MSKSFISTDTQIHSLITLRQGLWIWNLGSLSNHSALLRRLIFFVVLNKQNFSTCGSKQKGLEGCKTYFICIQWGSPLFLHNSERKIMRYPELEGTCKDHQAQLLAVHRTVPTITPCAWEHWHTLITEPLKLPSLLELKWEGVEFY